MPYISWQLNSSDDCISCSAISHTNRMLINDKQSDQRDHNSAQCSHGKLWYWMQLADVNEFVGKLKKVHESSNCTLTHCTCMSTSEISLNCNRKFSAHMQVLSPPSSCILVPVNTTTMCHMHFISHSAKLSRQLNMTKFPIFGKNESHNAEQMTQNASHQICTKIISVFSFLVWRTFQRFGCLRS